MTPQLVMMPPVRTSATRRPSNGAAAALFLDHPGDQVDVVVLAHRHQDDEQEQRQLPVQADERRAVEPHEDQLGHADADEEAQQHREDQVERDQRPAEHDDQHGQHGQRRQHADAGGSRSR